MTAGERLWRLAAQAGTAAALLLQIGTGATAGAALVNYSGLNTRTAAEHLLSDVKRSSNSTRRNPRKYPKAKHIWPSAMIGRF